MRKPFRITKTSVYQDRLTLWLDDILEYKDKSSNCITVMNKSPFTDYKEGNNVMIDMGVVAGFPKGTVLNESAN